ncbi:MAG TPA: hypothetical protein VGG00_02605 [Rhodanobacter sp.]|jgi:hypothetical protein
MIWLVLLYRKRSGGLSLRHFSLCFVGGLVLASFVALGLDHADWLAVDEQHVVCRAGLGGVFAHRDTGAAPRLSCLMSCTIQPAASSLPSISARAFASGVIHSPKPGCLSCECKSLLAAIKPNGPGHLDQETRGIGSPGFGISFCWQPALTRTIE